MNNNFCSIPSVKKIATMTEKSESDISGSGVVETNKV